MNNYSERQHTSASLGSTFRDHYIKDGFAYPVTVLSPADAISMRRDLETAEALLGDDTEKLGLLRACPQKLMPSFRDILFNPAIVKSGQALLGPDLLVWGVSIFIKEPHSDKIISWHQDLTYWGLDDNEEVTCWLALSDATALSGCMQFVAGSHKNVIQPHYDTFADNNLLSRGQELRVDVNPAEATDIVLNTGQASFHHGHLFHASGPNNSDDRRIGVAIRLIKPSMKQRGSEKLSVTQIAGKDDFDHFTHACPPCGFLNEADFRDARAERDLRNTIMFAGAAKGG